MNNSIGMRRKELPGTKAHWSNPGLLFDKGFKEWKSNNEQRGQDIQRHIRAVCSRPAPEELEIYIQAWKRWLTITGDPDRYAAAVGILENRLYIGLGMPHVLETQVTRQMTYGIPCIPGSALKGLARSWAMKTLQKDREVITVLFGTGSDDPEKADTGYLVFHDAWWVPGLAHFPRPYVPEVVTPHATEYYRNQGKDCPHPDLESPNPNNQIAVHGGFYFVIEGKKNWADWAMELLRQALQQEGMGGKVSSGYGYFNFPDRTDCWKILRKSHDLFSTEKKRRKNKLQKMRGILAAAEEAKRVAGFDLYRKAIYRLEQALSEREKTGRIPASDEIKRLVNVIIKDKEPWPQDKRADAEPFIEQAYNLTTKGNRRKKKLSKLQTWLKKGEL